MGEEVLQVQMLGGFSVTWNGISIAGGPKQRKSQFVYLLQLLLHYRREGVSRNLLEEVLFGEREVDNVHHSLRSTLYNARKRLRQAGLPDTDYILQKEGIFYWTDQIPVQEDAEAFEQACRKAEEETDPEQKLRSLLDTCYHYGGEFLPRQLGFIWIAQEARRYQMLYFSCVEQAVELLRDRQDWEEMERLGRCVSQNSPFGDWEVITMEALTSMGRLEEARKLYDDTVSSYMQEQGVRPSRRLRELLDRMGTQMNHGYAALDTIQSELKQTDEEERGGYLCSWPVFEGIYHTVRRMMERGGMSVYLMICTVVDSKGNPMQDGAALEELTGRLEQAICRSVRHADAVVKYGKGQYLVLLVNITLEDCAIVQKRIDEQFLTGRQRTGVRYYVNVVSCPEER